jgi:hypothetical protein
MPALAALDELDPAPAILLLQDRQRLRHVHVRPDMLGYVGGAQRFV